MDLSETSSTPATALHDRFVNARSAYAVTRMPGVQARRDALEQLDRLLTGNVKEIAAAISADFGNRSLHETQ